MFSLVAIKVLSWIVSTCLLVSCKEALKYYFFVDIILLAMLASVVVTSSLVVLIQNSLTAIPSILINAFMLFVMAGNFRVMIVFCIWAAWRVIIYKLVLIIGALFFMAIGCYLFLVDY